MIWAGLWSKAVGIAKGVPDVVWWIVLAVLAWRFIDLNARWDERARNKERQARAGAEQDGRVVDALEEIEERTDDEVSEAVRARDAAPRDVPAGELPRDVRERIFLPS